MSTSQLDLFDNVFAAYRPGDALSNEELYEQLVQECKLPSDAFERRVPIGKSGALHSPLKRQVRWYQQTLRKLNLLERDGSARGYWRLTPRGKDKLTPAAQSQALLGFSTHLGLALWSRCEHAFPHLGEPIHLVLSSLPYPLNVPRAYGNPKESEYVDWVCRILDPIIGQLADGASIALNVGNDVFIQGSPARSIYRERMVIALADRFGLAKMDELIWENPSRPPGPLRWASLSRQQLNAAYEPVYWFTNNPKTVHADNRRVLQPHSAEHLRLLAAGGERRTTSYGDGAHRIREGISFSNPTDGKIPRNVIRMGHRCADKSELAKLARAAGLPVHGATMPLRLARFIIEFLSDKNDLVVDPCAGWFRTAKAAEQTGRRWFATEQMGEYVLGGALGLQQAEGFEVFGHFDGPIPSQADKIEVIA